MKTLAATVHTAHGVPFNVVIVRKGDAYGLNDCLTHEKDEPLIEFYDARHDHTEHGQFVSRYYFSTLNGTCTVIPGAHIGRTGIDLDGRVDAWKLDRRAATEAMGAVEEILGRG
jgi:hypothetical protein